MLVFFVILHITLTIENNFDNIQKVMLLSSLMDKITYLYCYRHM